jgi:Spy/CpxP family protein refolding chaperone
MKMKKVSVLAAATFFAFASLAFAKGPGAMGGFKMPPGRWWQKPEVVEKLDLIPEEQTRLDDLALERERAMIDLRSNVQRQALELEALLDQEDFDRSACLDQFDSLVDARTAVARGRFDFHVAVRELLGLDRYRLFRTILRDQQRYRIRETLFSPSSTFSRKRHQGGSDRWVSHEP